MLEKFKKISVINVLKYLLFKIFDYLEKRESRFYSIHWRPKSAENVAVVPIHRLGEESIAIVMQGPVITKDAFTLETCTWYRKCFPDSALILSTWKGEDGETLARIRNLGWVVIENEKPAYPGFANINMQITSTHAGIAYAKKSGMTHAVKTRSDQRIYNQHTLQLFKGLSAGYPSANLLKQKERLIVPMDTPVLRLYGVGDMVMFGHIDDMLVYWGVQHDVRIIKIDPVPGDTAWDIKIDSRTDTVLARAQARLSEVYLTTAYLETLGHGLKWTLEDSWDMLGNYFCITDHALIDIFWHKNTLRQEYKHHYYTMNHTLNMMTFADWFLCYGKSFQKETLPEYVASIKEGASLESPEQSYVLDRLS